MTVGVGSCSEISGENYQKWGVQGTKRPQHWLDQTSRMAIGVGIKKIDGQVLKSSINEGRLGGQWDNNI